MGDIRGTVSASEMVLWVEDQLQEAKDVLLMKFRDVDELRNVANGIGQGSELLEELHAAALDQQGRDVRLESLVVVCHVGLLLTRKWLAEKAVEWEDLGGEEA